MKMKDVRILLLITQIIIGLATVIVKIEDSKYNNYFSVVPQVQKVQSSMSLDIKLELSQALSSIDESYAQMVLDSMTEIEVDQQSFLIQYQIYKVEYFNPHHPVVFYVAYAPNKSAYLLTDNPGNYLKLAQADYVVIDSPIKAAEYAKTYLEVTRSMSSLSYVVNSVTDVDFRPDLEEEELTTKLEFIKKYITVITAPTVKSDVDDYLITAYLVHEQDLNEYAITVKRNGEIITESKTLEENLPLVYGL